LKTAEEETDATPFSKEGVRTNGQKAMEDETRGGPSVVTYDRKLESKRREAQTLRGRSASRVRIEHAGYDQKGSATQKVETDAPFTEASVGGGKIWTNGLQNPFPMRREERDKVKKNDPT